MSGVAVVRFVLANNAAVVAQVPAARIMAGILPISTTLPAIGVSLVDTRERTNVAMDMSTIHSTARVQVTVLGQTYVQARTVIELVRKALGYQRGSINGVDVDSILPDDEGPDFRDPDTGVHQSSRDYFVRFNVATA